MLFPPRGDVESVFRGKVAGGRLLSFPVSAPLSVKEDNENSTSSLLGGLNKTLTVEKLHSAC